MIDILKEYYQSYKVPILIGAFFLLLIIVFLIGKHSAEETKKEQTTTLVSQDLLNDNNVLQNKLAISEQNAKRLQEFQFLIGNLIIYTFYYNNNKN